MYIDTHIYMYILYTHIYICTHTHSLWAPPLTFQPIRRSVDQPLGCRAGAAQVMNSYNSLQQVRLVKNVRLGNPAGKCSCSVSAHQFTSARQQLTAAELVRYHWSDCCNQRCRTAARGVERAADERLNEEDWPVTQMFLKDVYVKTYTLIIRRAVAWGAE